MSLWANFVMIGNFGRIFVETSPPMPHADLAIQLSTAFRNFEMIALTENARPADLVSAEAIEDNVIAQLGRIAAWKLGATNEAARAATGLARFFIGALPVDRVLRSGCTVAGSWSEEVGVECEYAFRFDRDLRPGTAPVDAKAVLAALGGVYAALEIPDCRYSEGLGNLGGLATVADDGAAGWLVVGDQCAVGELEHIRDAVVRFSVGGNVLAEGKAAERIERFPYDLLTDFVRLAQSRGYSIEAGQYVVMGSCTGYVKIPLGVTGRGDFGGLGAVEATFKSHGLSK
jgi:2-keto-4-pentenoate hydratase